MPVTNVNYLNEDGLIFLWSQLKTMLNDKVSKETGKSLLTDTEITRLASLVNYDDADVRSLINALSNKVNILESSGYDDTELRQFIAQTYATIANTYTKTQVDTQLGNKANKTDVYTTTQIDTSLSLKADKSTTYTKTEVDNAILAKIASVYTPKGNVANYAALPTTGLEIGWVYNCLDTGDNYVWMGVTTDFPDGWDKLSGTVDLSGYVQKSELTALTNDEILSILAM